MQEEAVSAMHVVMRRTRDPYSSNITPRARYMVIFRRGRGSTPAYSQAQLMFEGEAASLEALSKTNTLRVPKPLNVSTIPE